MCTCMYPPAVCWPHSLTLSSHTFRPFVQVQKLQSENFKPMEQLTLEPYERDHAVVVSVYRAPGHSAKKQKT